MKKIGKTLASLCAAVSLFTFACTKLDKLEPGSRIEVKGDITDIVDYGRFGKDMTISISDDSSYHISTSRPERFRGIYEGSTISISGIFDGPCTNRDIFPAHYESMFDLTYVRDINVLGFDRKKGREYKHINNSTKFGSFKYNPKLLSDAYGNLGGWIYTVNSDTETSKIIAEKFNRQDKEEGNKRFEADSFTVMFKEGGRLAVADYRKANQGEEVYIMPNNLHLEKK